MYLVSIIGVFGCSLELKDDYIWNISVEGHSTFDGK